MLRQRLAYAFAGAATMVLISVAPGVARAQASVGPAPMPGAAAQPFALGGLPFTVGLQERTTYDTNVARGNDINAAIRDVNTADWIIAPSVTLNYSSANPRQGFALKGYFGYDYYVRNEILRRESIDVSAAGNATFGRCVVGGQLAYDRGQSGLEDLTLLVTKNTIQTYTISANESCAIGPAVTQTISVHHSGTQNSTSSLVDYDTNGVSGSIGYSNRALGTVSLVASYDKTDYKNRAVVILGTPNSLESTDIGVSISRPIGARLAGHAGVFYNTSTSNLGPGALPGQNSDFDGLTANAGLTYTVGPRLVLNANLARDVQATIRQTAAYSVDDRIDISAGYTLSSRIHLSLGSTWSKQSFRGTAPLVLQTAPNQVDLWTLTAGASMRLGRNSALSADYSHENSNTDLALFDFKSDRISLTISTSF
ncbi:MAG TPA: outer membrane beta-barrel protein [Phenylobacterium sp.]